MKTKTPTQLLYNYCERRFDLQDEYYEDKITRTQRFVAWALVGVCVIFFGLTCLLANHVDNLQNQMIDTGCLYENRTEY